MLCAQDKLDRRMLGSLLTYRLAGDNINFFYSGSMTIKGFYICIIKHFPLTNPSIIHKHKSDSFISHSPLLNKELRIDFIPWSIKLNRYCS